MYGAWRTTTPVPPPILIDSRASCSGVGEKWLESWGPELQFHERIRSGREFRFGDGPAFPSQGEMNLPILIPKERTCEKVSHTLIFRVGVVKAVVPLVISHQALGNMQGRMDFSAYTRELPGRFTILLTKSSTGHVLLPGIVNRQILSRPTREYPLAFPAQQTMADRKSLTDDEVLKIHQQLGHCSEKQLVDLLKFGGCKVDARQIQRITQRCQCQRSVHRITPPVVSSWIARFSGEVVAVDIIHPFTGHGPEGLFPKWKATGKTPALLVVDSLTRFATCQILKSTNSDVVSQVVMSDWAKHFGKPKRIILDQGGPGLVGANGKH